jgi:hypothetical protein
VGGFTAQLLGCAYVVFYFAGVVLAPILAIAAGLLGLLTGVGKRVAKRASES